MADFSWRQGIKLAEQGVRFFSRQAGQLLGLVETQEEAENILRKAGFEQVTIHLPSQLAPRYGLPNPVLDFQLLAVARKAPLSAPPAA